MTAGAGRDLMSTQQQYTATARKDGRWWFIEVPALDISGQAASVSEVDAVAREVIGLVLDVEPDTIDVTVSVELPDSISTDWADARQAGERARAEQAAAAEKSRQVVQRLRAEHYTFPEIGRALGLSPQRVQAISKAAHAASSAS